jgi:hypothetical protein
MGNASEVWLPVPVDLYADKYEVSSLGNVRNIRTKHVLTPMRTGAKRQGSQRSKVRFSTNPRHDFDVAHLVLEAFLCARPEGHQAMHLDDDTTNNALDNLRWGTLSENMRDMARKHRGGSQKLTPHQVAEIVSRRHSGERGAALSREFGVSPQRVCDLFKGRTTLA